MTLLSYAAAKVAELSDELGGPEGTNAKPRLEMAINRATDTTEAYLRRRIVTRGSITEYHSFPLGAPISASSFDMPSLASYSQVPSVYCELYPREWPIISVTSVAEDAARSYGTLLAANTDYVVGSQAITRVSSASTGLRAWLSGFRAVRVIYAAGYATSDAVPWDLKGVVLELAALLWRESERKTQGLSGQSDATGNWQRFGPAKLTDDMKAQLAPHRRLELGSTWEMTA